MSATMPCSLDLFRSGSSANIEAHEKTREIFAKSEARLAAEKEVSGIMSRETKSWTERALQSKDTPSMKNVR